MTPKTGRSRRICLSINPNYGIRHDGEMTAENWSDPLSRSVALFIHGATDPDIGADGTAMTDGDFLMLVNS